MLKQEVISWPFLWIQHLIQLNKEHSSFNHYQLYIKFTLIVNFLIKAIDIQLTFLKCCTSAFKLIPFDFIYNKKVQSIILRIFSNSRLIRKNCQIELIHVYEELFIIIRFHFISSVILERILKVWKLSTTYPKGFRYFPWRNHRCTLMFSFLLTVLLSMKLFWRTSNPDDSNIVLVSSIEKK